MFDRAKMLHSFRARLMLLLTGFLVLALALVLGLDKWAQQRVNSEVERQNEEVKEAVASGLGDFADAQSLAIQSLVSDQYLYEVISAEEMPRTVEHIIVTDANGNVLDSTLSEVVGSQLEVPSTEEPDHRPGSPIGSGDQSSAEKTYYFPVTTTRGLHWLVIVTNREAIFNKIESASNTMALKIHELSNYRIGATSGLLILALAIAVIIGWRFTRPIQSLARAARRVAAGDLDFNLKRGRRDEIGQLIATFNEMINELRSKQELEEKLNQAERSAVIGRLTQSVAHEIRNPLNVINLSIDHAGKFAPSDETQRKQFMSLLSSIKDEIVRLNRLVGGLLNYGRPARLAVETVDMVELVDETLAFVRAQADEQSVDVNFETNGLPARVRGDRERLKSCLSNIAINALQAMPNGGRLSVRVDRANGLVEVVINDTGIGIGEESLTKIFEPYFSTKQTGFGLGLAVTQKIVEEHRGEIQVRSAVNSGTTFTVRLPSAMDAFETAETNGEPADGKE